MADPTVGEARAAFLSTFRATARYKHRYDVFRDFVTMAAISLHNGILRDEIREEEYLKLINSYEQEDQTRIAQLLGHLVMILEPEPRDALGPLYMELEIANKDAGQFFTPSEVSDAMSQITFGDLDEKLDTQPFITLAEPACGAGGMVLSAVNVMVGKGHDPAKRLWVQCIDVDRLAALMCYVQLSLWNVPAEIIVGNTLTWQHREVWYTPAHYMGRWSVKLKHAAEKRAQEMAADHTPPADTTDHRDPDPQLVSPPPPTPAPSAEDPETPVETSEPEPELIGYETHQIIWRGQEIEVRWCPNYSAGVGMSHLEVITPDRSAHPISETGYKSHFIHRGDVEEAGGPVAFVTAWLTQEDDGKAVQLSLF